MPLLVNLLEIDPVFENMEPAREKKHITKRNLKCIHGSSQCKEKEKIEAPLIWAVALPSP
jgi:hypothetical protein